jgi:hypothetical protein
MPTEIPVPAGTEETLSILLISWPAPPPPWFVEPFEHPPPPPPPTNITSTFGELFAGRTHVPPLKIVTSYAL